MPLGPGIRYRVTRKGGKMIRLAFKGNKVVEAKEIEPAAGKAKQRKPKHRP